MKCQKWDNKEEKDFEKEKDQLYKEIGKMKDENEWLKKARSSVLIDATMIESDHSSISIKRQCDLLGVSRSSYYYKPETNKRTEDNKYKKLIFEEYLV